MRALVLQPARSRQPNFVYSRLYVAPPLLLIAIAYWIVAAANLFGLVCCHIGTKLLELIHDFFVDVAFVHFASFAVN